MSTPPTKRRLTPGERAGLLQKKRPAGDDPLWKTLVSRGVLFGVGLALLWGGYGLLGVQSRIDEDPMTQQLRGGNDGGSLSRTRARARGTGGVITRLPLIGAVGLFVVGGVLSVAAVMPVSVASRFVSPA